MSYGCYYFAHSAPFTEQYLPQVELDVHATILSLNSRTVITQIFVNPSSDPIAEVSYIFPLYDRSSIVGFTCSVDDVVLRGCVKSKENADKAYQQAISMGQSAAVMDQSQSESDVFQTRVGNVPAGRTVVIKITLVAELKQDLQTNGPRYTVPSKIAPRYGESQDMVSVPSAFVPKASIKVDITLDKGSIIRSIQSPSHPIQVGIGRTSSMSESTFQPYFASAELHVSLDLNKDFVLNVTASKPEAPFALLETHPTLPNQRALMVSLMPKFNLAPHAPEIVFVIDRSGSMRDQIPTLKSALEVFLKSLPVGVYFNLVSFGTHHSCLWPRSRDFDEESLQQALAYIQVVAADMGGTKILFPLQAAVEQRYKDRDLELLLLTDGRVSNQQAIFQFLTMAAKEESVRAFALGIGSSVSHSLIEGIARAGKGFSQVALENEKMDAKVIRMLKGALSSRIQNSFLDIDMQPLDEDFEVVEPNVSPPKPISLFQSEQTESEIVQTVKEPLPKLTIPAALNAPTELPPLFPFIQSTSYVLLAPSSGPLPEKITLRANSKQGRLELEIPVEDIGQGETIHQLAVKRAILEIEDGRGWIQAAKDSQGKPIKEKHESQLNELVKAECQRLGTQFQVPGKFCSFVAVDETNPSKITIINTKAKSASHDSGSKSARISLSMPHCSRAASFASNTSRLNDAGTLRRGTDGAFGAFDSSGASMFGVSNASYGTAFGATGAPQFGKPVSSGFGSRAPFPPPSSSNPSMFGAPSASTFSGGLFGGRAEPMNSTGSSLFGAPSANTPSGGLFGSSSAAFGQSSSLSGGRVGAFGGRAELVASAGSSLFGTPTASFSGKSTLGGFGTNFSTTGLTNTTSAMSSLPAPSPSQSGQFGGFGTKTEPEASTSGGLFGGPSANKATTSLFGGSGAKSTQAVPSSSGMLRGLGGAESMVSCAASTPAGASVSGNQSFGNANASQQTNEPDRHDWTRILIRLQKFDGFWDLDEDLLRAVSLDLDSTRAELEKRLKRLFGESTTLWDRSDIVRVLATCLACICLEKKASDSLDVWELVKEKADRWVEQAIERMCHSHQVNARIMKRELGSLF